VQQAADRDMFVTVGLGLGALFVVEDRVVWCDDIAVFCFV
jgi:hypothetical protein